MDNKLQIFKELFKELDIDRYNILINNVHVVDSLLYEGKHYDELVIVHTSNMKTKIPLTQMFYDSLYSLTAAYEKVFGRELRSHAKLIDIEELSKYESLDDYFRVKDMELANSRAKYNEKVSMFKERFERASVNPENLYAIIEKQQNEIDRLTEELHASKKKKQLFK